MSRQSSINSNHEVSRACACVEGEKGQRDSENSGRIVFNVFDPSDFACRLEVAVEGDRYGHYWRKQHPPSAIAVRVICPACAVVARVTSPAITASASQLKFLKLIISCPLCLLV